MDKELFRRSYKNETQRAINLDSMAFSQGDISGKFTVNNTGEAFKNVYFPVSFSQVPGITFGYELKPYDKFIEGSRPSINAYVNNWIVEDKPPFKRKYLGANITVISTGPKFHKFIVHWKATGLAYSNPV